MTTNKFYTLYLDKSDMDKVKEIKDTNLSKFVREAIREKLDQEKRWEFTKDGVIDNFTGNLYTDYEKIIPANIWDKFLEWYDNLIIIEEA